MADVLLFNQYFSSKKDFPEIVLASLPINLLCLASYLKVKGIDCKIYELGIFDLKKTISENNRIRCGMSDKEITKIIENERPKIIGLGCMYSIHYIDVIAIARLIKKTDPAIKVVLGGNHATVFYDSVLKDEAIDFVVRGEGELTFYDLCNSLLSHEDNFKNINGLSFRNTEKKIITNPPRGLIPDLDELPMSEYSLLEIEKYANPVHKSPYLMRTPHLGIVTSRGCPGSCVFCTIKAVWGRTWRAKSAKKTVDEIEFLHNRYGIREFSFLDDSASLDKKRWNSICEEFINRELNIKWTTPNGIAYWTLDKPILKKMRDVGCYRITFGIESGSEETRKFIGKTHPLSQARELIRYANKIGMWTICTNILGFPFETKESMADTVKFAKKSGTDFATFFLLAPHLTSDVYSYFEKEGLINFSSILEDNEFDEEKYDSMYRVLNDGGFPTRYFTAGQLKKMQIRSYKDFIIYRALTYLINPMRLLRKIHSPEDIQYTIRLLYNGFKIFLRSFYRATTKKLLYNYLGKDLKGLAGIKQ